MQRLDAFGPSRERMAAKPGRSAARRRVLGDVGLMQGEQPDGAARKAGDDAPDG